MRNEGDNNSRELLYDSMDQWKSTAIGRQLFFLFLGNATEMASYMLGQYNEQDVVIAASGVTNGNNKVSSGASFSRGLWGEDSYYPEANFFSSEASDYGNATTDGNATGNSSDSTNSTLPRDNFSSPYLMPWPQRSAWIAIFTFLVIVAAVGNSLVAWIVFGQLASLFPHFCSTVSHALRASIHVNFGLWVIFFFVVVSSAEASGNLSS